MRYLIVGDPHLELKNLDTGRLFLERLLEQTGRCDRVIFLGDLFHTFAILRSEVLALWNDFFNKAGSKCIAIVGNHDYAGQTGGNHALEVFKDRIKVIDQIDIVDGAFFIPFMRDDHAFESIVKEIPAGSILFCHQPFNGADFGMGYMADNGVDVSTVSHLKVIAGHIHANQTLGTVWYPGSPYQSRFDDIDLKVVHLIEIIGQTYEIIDKIDLGLPRFYTVKQDKIDQIALPEPDPAGSYRFVAKGSPAEIAAFWARDDVKMFRSKVKKTVDALIPERGEVNLPGMASKSKKDRLNDFIASKKWRTPTDRLIARAASFFTK